MNILNDLRDRAARMCHGRVVFCHVLLDAATDRIKALEAENAKLRETLSACAKAAGASVFPDCTLEFMAFIPEEIRLAIAKTKRSDK
jgi:hypothetical protein